MTRASLIATAAALIVLPALANEQNAADNAPGSQTQEMQGRVDTSNRQALDNKAPDSKVESRGMSADQYPTTTGAARSNSTAAPQPQPRGDQRR
jgi:hypothetical protein